MIDIHSHILPGVDDGSQSLSESLEMLEIAVSQGITTQVLTPHIHFGRFDNTKFALNSAFEQFSQEVANAGIDINLKLAAEVRIGPELMQLVNTDSIPWLTVHNQKRYFLLEFPRQDVPFGSDNMVRWLLTNNCMPIIVHPERNRTFVDNPSKLQPFIDLGCPLQITASSLSGKFGDDVKDMAFALLETSKAKHIASDCHNLKGRRPDLGEVMQSLPEHIQSMVVAATESLLGIQ